MNVSFNINILNQLLLRDTERARDVTARFPKIYEWTNNQSWPTYLQLVSLANYFNIPFGYFFLNAIPERKYPIPHYRSISDRSFKPSQDLLETIQLVQKRQEWAKDILKEFQSPLKFAKSISTKTSIADAAILVRQILGLPINWSESANLETWNDAFKYLLNKTEEAGIFVVVNGIVNNNTSRALNISEFRGFVLYDNYAPFIFINNRDFITGKIFTIVHEIVHILIGESASFDFTNLMPADNTIEEYCNAVTAEFLVPKSILETHFEKTGAKFDTIAKIFKVSRIVIARRLLDLKKISKKEFIEAYNSFRNTSIENPNVDKKEGGGGDFYNTAPYRISRNFFNLVYTSVKQEKMLYRDAFRLTGLSAKTFDGYVKEYLTSN